MGAHNGPIVVPRPGRVVPRGPALDRGVVTARYSVILSIEPLVCVRVRFGQTSQHYTKELFDELFEPESDKG